jgi:hypothetical protein
LHVPWHEVENPKPTPPHMSTMGPDGPCNHAPMHLGLRGPELPKAPSPSPSDLRDQGSGCGPCRPQDTARLDCRAPGAAGGSRRKRRAVFGPGGQPICGAAIARRRRRDGCRGDHRLSRHASRSRVSPCSTRPVPIQTRARSCGACVALAACAVPFHHFIPPSRSASATMAFSLRAKAFAGPAARVAAPARAVRMVVRASAQKQQQQRGVQLPAPAKAAMTAAASWALLAGRLERRPRAGLSRERWAPGLGR